MVHMKMKLAVTLAAGVLGGALLALFTGYAWVGVIGFVVFATLAFAVTLPFYRSSGPYVVIGAAAASLLAFALLMPVGCASSSSGDWRCQSITGLQLPGYAGRGDSSPSLLIPVVFAGVVGAVVATISGARHLANPLASERTGRDPALEDCYKDHP